MSELTQRTTGELLDALSNGVPWQWVESNVDVIAGELGNRISTLRAQLAEEQERNLRLVEAARELDAVLSLRVDADKMTRQRKVDWLDWWIGEVEKAGNKLRRALSNNPVPPVERKI